jgi:pimeloyl-ACP methyl ester carboxylesterase
MTAAGFSRSTGERGPGRIVSTPDSMELPRCARRVELTTPDGPLAAIEAGPRRPADAAALLVPGFTGSKEDFLPLLAPLADAGVRTLAIDQRGQCDSPGLDDPAGYDPQRFGAGCFGADIRALVRSIAADGSGPVHLLGHSFGGHTVREALLGAYADGEPLPLASVTLLDSGPAAVIGKDSRDQLELLLALGGTMTLRQLHELSPVDVHGDPRVREFLLRRWLSNDPASLFAMARRLLAEPDRTDELKAALDGWGLPRLIVTGIDEDVWSAELLRETAVRLDARFTVIPGAGHSPNTQQPELLAKALLEFWLG